MSCRISTGPAAAASRAWVWRRSGDGQQHARVRDRVRSQQPVQRLEFGGRQLLGKRPRPVGRQRVGQRHQRRARPPCVPERSIAELTPTESGRKVVHDPRSPTINRSNRNLNLSPQPTSRKMWVDLSRQGRRSPV